MTSTFEDKLIKAEKVLQEKIKDGDSLRIAIARVGVQYAKSQLSNAKRAAAARQGK